MAGTAISFYVGRIRAEFFVADGSSSVGHFLDNVTSFKLRDNVGQKLGNKKQTCAQPISATIISNFAWSKHFMVQMQVI